MPEKPKIIYPILSRRNVDGLLRKLTRGNSVKGVTLDFARVNQGDVALHVALDHKNNGPLDNLDTDDLITHVGFEFKPCATLDGRYGGSTKYYNFKRRNDLWIAMADNCYDEDYTRILIRWHEKLDRKMSEDVLYELNVAE